jgi:hypothetical protein
VRRQRELVEHVREVERGDEEVEQEREDHDDRDDLAGEAGPEHASPRQPDAGEREGIEPEDDRPGDGGRHVAAGDRGPEADAHHHHQREDADRGVDPEPAVDRPASPRHRRREQGLEPAVVLVGGPAADERRRGEPGEDQPEGDERELEERPRARQQVHAREDRLEDGEGLGRELLERLGERERRGAEDEAHDPDADAPPKRRGEPLAQRASRRSAEAQEAGRQARPRDPARRPKVAPGEQDDADGEQDDRHDRHRHERRPLELARQRLVMDGPPPPRQVGQRREGGDGRPIAIREVADEQHGTGDRRGGPPAEERCQRPGH